MKSNPFRYEVIKPRFRYMPASPLVKLVDNERIEIRTRNAMQKVFVIPLTELTTQRAITIAVQQLAGYSWASKEILMTFISVAMCCVPTESPTPVDISRVLR